VRVLIAGVWHAVADEKPIVDMRTTPVMIGEELKVEIVENGEHRIITAIVRTISRK
jgi:hypothetical protein